MKLLILVIVIAVTLGFTPGGSTITTDGLFSLDCHETGVAQRHRPRGLVQRRVAQVEAHELASILQVGLLGCWQHALREVIDACRLDRVNLDALGRLIVVAELRRVVRALVQALELNVDSRLPNADHV